MLSSSPTSFSHAKALARIHADEVQKKHWTLRNCRMAVTGKLWECPLPAASNPRVRDAQGSEPKPRRFLSPRRRGYERHYKSRYPKKEKSSNMALSHIRRFHLYFRYTLFILHMQEPQAMLLQAAATESHGPSIQRNRVLSSARLTLPHQEGSGFLYCPKQVKQGKAQQQEGPSGPVMIQTQSNAKLRMLRRGLRGQLSFYRTPPSWQRQTTTTIPPRGPRVVARLPE